MQATEWPAAAASAPPASATAAELAVEGLKIPSTADSSKEHEDARNQSTAAVVGDVEINGSDALESSVATLKPPPTIPPVLELATAASSHSRETPVSLKRISIISDRSPTRSDAGFDDGRLVGEQDEGHTPSSSEIQDIMEQFSEQGKGPGEEEIMSPRLEIARQSLSSPIQHPPRKSSLEPLSSPLGEMDQSFRGLGIGTDTTVGLSSNTLAQESTRIGMMNHLNSPSSPQDRRSSIGSPISQPSIFRPPPPDPDPEPDLPFDFHRFLEQLRHRTADPVARFLRSFLQEFARKQWMVHEQIKIISDFLAFITNKMAHCEVWREVSDAEFDNAREGMEKLVMNRLYTQTFSPAIPPPQPIPGNKAKRKGGERLMGPGRRGQHQEDVERDEVFAQKVSIYNWVSEEHLDIPPVGDGGRRFLLLAQQGMLDPLSPA